MIHKKIISSGILIGSLLLIGQITFGQNDSLPKGCWKANLFHVWSNELQVFYEKPLRLNQSREYALGVIYPNAKLSESAIGFFSSTYFYDWGILGGIGRKTYLQNNWYGRTSCIFKLSYFPKSTVWYGGWGGSAYANEELMSDFKFTINPRFSFGYCKIGSIADFTMGFGLNIITHYSTIYGSRFFGGEGYTASVPNNDVSFPYHRFGLSLWPTLMFTCYMGGPRR